MKTNIVNKFLDNISNELKLLMLIAISIHLGTLDIARLPELPANSPDFGSLFTPKTIGVYVLHLLAMSFLALDLVKILIK